MSHYPLTPDEESPTSGSYGATSSYGHPSNSYGAGSYHGGGGGGGGYASQEPSWTSTNHGSSLSSLLNPASQHQNAPQQQYASTSRPHPTINTNTAPTSSYSSPFSSMPMRHSPPPLSPDSHSRPNTGYSMSSVGSVPYDDYDNYGSRPNSSHRPPSASPVSRPGSSHYGPGGASSLSIRRGRRHSQAMSPYPSPYDHNDQQRPSTSPQPFMHMADLPQQQQHQQQQHQGHPSLIPSNNFSRVRSMVQLPGVDSYGFNPHHAEFAYSMWTLLCICFIF